MIGLIIAFFFLTLGAGILGFAGLTGFLAQIAQALTVLFAIMLVASILYSAILDHNPRLRMRAPLP